MTKLNKSTISPVMEHGHGYVFHASGQNFKMTGNVVEMFNTPSAEFNSLVTATKLFTINESGIEFYYDWNAKSKVSKLDEKSLSNFNKMLELNEKLSFLKESRQELKLNKGESAIESIDTEISLVESNLTEIKRGPIGIYFRYDVNENKFYMNSSEILAESLTEHAFASGHIKYEDKSILNLFEFAANNFNSYKILEFVTESIDGDVKVLAIRADKNIYTCRINEATKLVKFQRMLADAAVEYVVENTGADITFMVEDILESFKERRAAKDAKIQTMHEMIAFLKDQKARLDEADKNIPEIKEADQLLNSEIARIQEEIATLESESILNRGDGYITATLRTEYENLAAGTELKVDAVEYTGAGKDDLLTVFVNDEPLRVEKYRIELPSGEAI